MQKAGLLARLRYGFDKTMAAGAVALVGWLALISLLVITAAGLFLAASRIAPDGAEPLSFMEGFWASLMRTLDAGTMGADSGWSFRVVMLLVTLAGIFIVSALIGVLSSGIEAKLDELRKGRSKVIEGDHTIILNWSASVFDILGELAIANESRRRPRIVIMADMDKVEMEDEIAAKAPKLGKTKVICRRGDPTDLSDLQIVSPQASRSIIILSPEGENPDAQVIKSIVALVNDPARREAPYQIAAEIRDARNMDVARTVGGQETQLILADELIARIMVHSSRESGLSAVYTELLDFDGSEIYVTEQPELAGKSFGQALHAFDHCALIGLAGPDGSISLNPPMDKVITSGEKAILIAEDDSMIQPGKGADMLGKMLPKRRAGSKAVPERTLLLGWNRRGPIIARELSRYVAKGSVLTIMADVPGLKKEAQGLGSSKMKVEAIEADTTRLDLLEALNIPSYHHVLVLGLSDHLPEQTADTHTLITLLHLRRIADKAGAHVNVVSEMIDVRNRQLAEVTRADDFVVSNKLVSLMLAQASENEHIAAIFEELLNADGSEIHMRDAAGFAAEREAVNFHAVTQAAAQRGEVAIGYAKADGRVAINPPKTDVLSFGPGDLVVVLSRE